MKAVAVVYFKELRDALRDRRSLVSALVFALFGPLVVGMALGSLARKATDDRPLEVLVVAPRGASGLIDSLTSRRTVVTRSTVDLEALESAVRSAEVEVALWVEDSFDTDLAAFERPRVITLWDASRRNSVRDHERLLELLAGWRDAAAGNRLVARGVAPEATEVVRFERRDLSTPSSRAATALAMVPIFLLMSTFIGGMAAAIDVTAGERERGSLETLLLSPTPRGALAAGKWLAASTLNALVVAATLGITLFVVRSPRLDVLGLRLGEDLLTVAGLLAVLLPLALLGPALQMLSAMFSHSFKEAQTYVSLLTMAPALPGFLFAFRDVEVAEWMRWAPIVGHQLAIDRLLRGEAPTVATELALLGATVLAAIATVLVVARLLRRERLVVLS